ncbi:hypothetical protein CBL_12536 [Carabus blaptoides fortunei]
MDGNPGKAEQSGESLYEDVSSERLFTFRSRKKTIQRKNPFNWSAALALSLLQIEADTPPPQETDTKVSKRERKNIIRMPLLAQPMGVGREYTIPAPPQDRVFIITTNITEHDVIITNLPPGYHFKLCRLYNLS